MNMTQFRHELATGRYFDRFLASLPPRWRELAPWLRLYVVILLLAGLAFQLAHPIMLTDSDMWYHLDGGRWFWEHHAIPTTSFFSFIDPPREFTNYYWGFQALLAALYEAGGYWALLVTRALLFSLTAWLAWRYIAEEKGIDHRQVIAVLLFIAYFTFIHDRVINLRPHLFSHLFILAFLYILERRPTWAPALPVITVAWANLHGIEYPVPVLIGGAYFIEQLYQRHVRKETDPLRGMRYSLSLLACIPALLVNPFGIDLLTTPFDVASHVNLYIQEMRPLDTRLLYSLLLSGEQLGVETVFSVTFVIVCILMIRNLVHGSLRVSHALIAIGAYVLLSRGYRFIWEWALLVLPLLTHAFSDGRPAGTHAARVTIRSLLVIAVMLLPIATLAHRLPTQAQLPFEPAGSPAGIARFLQQHGGGGFLMTPPSRAGYLQSYLGDDYKIYVDLQMSLFDAYDIYSLLSFYRNADGMAQLLDRYQPAFITANLGTPRFRELIAGRDDYRLVFFDDSQVLWASVAKKPALVERFELKRVNPFNLLEVADDKNLDAQLDELARVIELYPDSERALHAVVRLLFNAERYEEALPWAMRFAGKFPQDPNSHYLLGDIYENSGRCAEAIPAYQASMRHADAGFKKVLHAHIGACHYVLQDFGSAYDHLWRGHNPFKSTVASEDLYQLAFSAFVVGKTDEAVLLLKMILAGDGDSQDAVTGRAASLLEKIERDTQPAPSFLDWVGALLSGRA